MHAPAAASCRTCEPRPHPARRRTRRRSAREGGRDRRTVAVTEPDLRRPQARALRTPSVGARCARARRAPPRGAPASNHLWIPLPNSRFLLFLVSGGRYNHEGGEVGRLELSPDSQGGHCGRGLGQVPPTAPACPTGAARRVRPCRRGDPGAMTAGPMIHAPNLDMSFSGLQASVPVRVLPTQETKSCRRK